MKAYGVDFVAAGCVEKKDMQKLLTKTRKERGWPPKAATSGANDDNGDDDDDEVKMSSASSSRNASTSSAAGGGDKAKSRGSSSSGKSAKATLSKLRVAVLFDPDNDEVRDAAQFIQPVRKFDSNGKNMVFEYQYDLKTFMYCCFFPKKKKKKKKKKKIM